MARTSQHPNKRVLDLRPRKPRLLGPTRPQAFGGPLQVSTQRKRRAAEVQAEDSDPDSDIEISVDSDSVFEVSDLEQTLSDLELDEHADDAVNLDPADLDENGADLQVRENLDNAVNPQGHVAPQLNQPEDVELLQIQAEDVEEPPEQVEDI